VIELLYIVREAGRRRRSPGFTDEKENEAPGEGIPKVVPHLYYCT